MNSNFPSILTTHWALTNNASALLMTYQILGEILPARANRKLRMSCLTNPPTLAELLPILKKTPADILLNENVQQVTADNERPWISLDPSPISTCR